MIILCGCESCVIKCMGDMSGLWSRGPGMPGWTYTCETCGNKRCPHHVDHRFVCAGSNDVGQVGILA